MSKVKMYDVFSKEYVKGFKQGLLLAQDVSKKQGFTITFPDFDSIEVERK